MLGRFVGFAQKCVAMRSSFEPSGRALRTSPRKSRGSRLSGGVRSLPQVPWWNAERRARRKARAARKRGGYGTAPIGVPLSFYLVLFPGAAQHAVMRCRTGTSRTLRLRRSRIGDAPLARRILSGKRIAFLSARDRDGRRPHRRRRLTKIMPGRRLFAWSSAWLGREGAPRERWRSSAPAKRGRGTTRSVVEGARRSKGLSAATFS